MPVRLRLAHLKLKLALLYDRYSETLGLDPIVERLTPDPTAVNLPFDHVDIDDGASARRPVRTTDSMVCTTPDWAVARTLTPLVARALPPEARALPPEADDMGPW